jgi:transposase
MYIRVTKNSRGNAYYHLVESFRHEGKVRQRVLLSLGRVDEGKLQQLAEAVSKHLDRVTALNLAESIDISQAYLFGPLLLLQHMTEQLGISNVLSGIAQRHDRLQFSFERAVFSMIVSRFMEPISKLGLCERMLDRFYPGLFDNDIELQHLYRSLDLLSIHKEEIEKQLFYYGKNLFNVQVDVVLYDLTTLRFESTRTDLGDLPRFGYSKERRSDCTQVVLGLLTDKEFISNANYRKYVCINSKDKPTLNQEAIEKERRKDGFFGIITNVKKDAMSAARIISEYKQLWRIEDAFGELKGTFKTRPVFHWTDDRIIGHIMICFLAYLCEAHLTKNLRAKSEQLNSKAIEKDCIKPRPLTLVRGLKELNQVLAIPIKMKKQTIWIRTDIPENAMKLLKAISIKIPPKILKKEEM